MPPAPVEGSRGPALRTPAGAFVTCSASTWAGSSVVAPWVMGGEVSSGGTTARGPSVVVVVAFVVVVSSTVVVVAAVDDVVLPTLDDDEDGAELDDERGALLALALTGGALDDERGALLALALTGGALEGVPVAQAGLAIRTPARMPPPRSSAWAELRRFDRFLGCPCIGPPSGVLSPMIQKGQALNMSWLSLALLFTMTAKNPHGGHKYTRRGHRHGLVTILRQVRYNFNPGG